MDKTEKTSQYPDNVQRVAVQTQVSGGVESDVRYYVFGSTIDEVLVMHDGTGDLYYAHDHLYSPVALFAANGTVAERYEYDAYGQVQILTSNFSPLTSSQHGNPYAFTGRELDTLDAGSRTLMYYRARTYDPETGRFMQRDQLDYIDGTNLYQYVHSNPIIMIDYNGRYAESIIADPSELEGFRSIYEVLSCNNNEGPGLLDYIENRYDSKEDKVHNVIDAMCHFLSKRGTMKYWATEVIRSFRNGGSYETFVLSEINSTAYSQAKWSAKCGRQEEFRFFGSRVGIPSPSDNEIIQGDWTPTVGTNLIDILLGLHAGGVVGGGVDSISWQTKCTVTCGGSKNDSCCKCHLKCITAILAQDTFNIKWKIESGPAVIIKYLGEPFDTRGSWTECYEIGFSKGGLN